MTFFQDFERAILVNCRITIQGTSKNSPFIG
jgi:hypothetical protein